MVNWVGYFCVGGYFPRCSAALFGCFGKLLVGYLPDWLVDVLN